jgi:hypothetical protein
MADKPKQWSAEYASIFADQSVVAAYQYRPGYPAETFGFLPSLIPAACTRRTVLTLISYSLGRTAIPPMSPAASPVAR